MGMLFCVQLACGISIPQVFADEPTGVLQFQDNFSGGLGKWSIAHKEFHTIGEEAALYSDSKGICTATVAGGATRWGATTVTFGVRFLSMNSGGMLRLVLRSNGADNFVLLMRPNEARGIRYYYHDGAAGVGERPMPGTNFNYLQFDTDYFFKIVNGDTRTEVYMKESAEAEYGLVCSLDLALTSKGAVQWISNRLLCKITDFKLYNDNAGAFYVPKKSIKGKAGTTRTIQPVNNTGSELTLSYTSNQPGRVAVDAATGELTFAEAGRALITVTGTAEDGTVYTDTFNALSSPALSTFGFNATDVTLYVGDSMNVCCVLRPDTLENRRVTWAASNDVVTLIGNMDESKTVKANKAGTATVTIRSQDTGNLSYRPLTVHVIERPTDVLQESFTQTGTVREIPPYFYGMHSNPLDGIAYTAKQTVMDREARFAGYYSDLKLDFVRFMLNTFDWKTGNYRGSSSADCYSMEDIFTAGNGADIPYMIVAADTDTADDIVGMIQEVKRVNQGKPIFLEMGNETYNYNAYSAYFPEIEDFTNRVKETYTKVKAIAPDVQIAVPLYEWEACEAAKKTGANIHSLNGRIAAWDDSMLAIRDYYDAVVIHRYSGPVWWERISGTDLMNGMQSFVNGDSASIATLCEKFGKEVWVSEYGDLPKVYQFAADTNDSKYTWPQSESERARLQYSKSAGCAVSYMTRTLNFLNNENITMVAYHYFSDAQCFGVIQDDVKLPNWYVFEKLGELLKENPCYHQLTPDGTSKVTAYGLGTEDKLQKVVFSNLNGQSAEVSAGNWKLKKVWSYGGDNPLPDYGAYTDFYTSLPTVIPQPEVFDNAPRANTLRLEPYSVAVAEVYPGDPVFDAAVDADLQAEAPAGVAVSGGSTADGVYYLDDTAAISTQAAFADEIIELDCRFEEGGSLELAFNQADGTETAYYNRMVFGTGDKLYQTLRLTAQSETGGVEESAFVTNQQAELLQNVRYRVRVVKRDAAVLVYLMNLEAADPVYEFCGKLADENISSARGTVSIRAAAAAEGQKAVVPYRLKVYDANALDRVYLHNAEVSKNDDNRLSVSCDVYCLSLTKEAGVIAAVYAGDTLIDAKLTQVNGNDYKTTVAFNDLQAAGTDCQVKFFAWDMASIQPFTSACVCTL